MTDLIARNAKPRAKIYRLADEKGLYLEVHPSGSRYWRMKYRSPAERNAKGNLKERRLALGVYPEVTLAAARSARDAARKLLASDVPVDPQAHRRAQRAAASARREAVRIAETNGFEVVAREWYAKQAPIWVVSHGDRIIRRLENDIFPVLGERAIDGIEPPDLLAALRKIEARGAGVTAHRAMQNCSRVFRYAIATGRARRDPTADLRGALAPVRPRHHASITEPKAVGLLMRTLSGYSGAAVTRCALRLAPLVFVRPGELRHGRWQEIDFEDALWRIPAARMKMREQHLVPLSTQALAILRELHAITGAGGYLFPSVRTNARPMSENTINAALRGLGYAKDQMTGHGFRSMASTLLNELGWNRDAIERQLAHAERDNVRAAYNFAEHLPTRRKMMQAWADYLDQLCCFRGSN